MTSSCVLQFLFKCSQQLSIELFTIRMSGFPLYVGIENLKFKDFSKTFKGSEVAFSRTNSRRKFTTRTVLQQYLISVSVITGQF